MQRFTNQPLSENPHIAVLGSDKVGNFVITTPLLRGLREKYPTAVVDFFGSAVTAALEESCPHIAARFSLYGAPDNLLHHLHHFTRMRQQCAGPYDLVINCNAFSEASLVVAALLSPRYVVGPALRPDMRGPLPEPDHNDDLRSRLSRDECWNRPNLAYHYAGLLESGYIAEIFCRLAYVETDFHRTEIRAVPPPLPAIPDVLFHTTATRSAKEWPAASWEEVAGWCRKHAVSVGLVGSRAEAEKTPDPYRRLIQDGVRDLRGAMTLPELAGAFQRARAAVVVDAGPLHIAAAVGCQTICVTGNDIDGVGASPFHLWMPRGPHIHIVHTPAHCTKCADERFRNRACLIPDHPCLRLLEPECVIQPLRRVLAGRLSFPLPCCPKESPS